MILKVDFSNGIHSDVEAADLVMNKDELVDYIKSFRFLGNIRRFEEVYLLLDEKGNYFRPLFVHFVLWLVSKGGFVINRDKSPVETYSLKNLFVESFVFTKACSAYAFLFVAKLLKGKPGKLIRGEKLRIKSGEWSVAYINATVWESEVVGGAVAHTIGIVDAFEQLGHKVTAYVTDKYPFYSKCIQRIVNLSPWNYQIPKSCHISLERKIFKKILDDNKIQRFDFIYQRYSVYTLAGFYAAKKLRIPLILEFNGSEAWINKHWGESVSGYRGLRKLEANILQSADLIVTVSNELRDDLLSMGVHDSNIVVQPNGVSTDVFHTKIDGSELKQQLGMEHKVTFGFCGSFGKWHGVEWLVESYLYQCLIDENFRSNTCLLLIGKGRTYEACRRLVAKAVHGENVRFMGVIPQKDCVNYLNLCDVLVSPTQPSTKEKYFFGSPTKIFEYMALGKAVISSRVGQMERIFNSKSIYFVDPDVPGTLTRALSDLYADKATRVSLGESASTLVLEHYSWVSHVSKVIGSMKDACFSK